MDNILDSLQIPKEIIIKEKLKLFVIHRNELMNYNRTCYSCIFDNYPLTRNYTFKYHRTYYCNSCYRNFIIEKCSEISYTVEIIKSKNINFLKFFMKDKSND
jgi:transposase-like protein